MTYYMNLSSQNKKVGAIPVATITRSTCPSSCPLKNNGCYAESGPLRIHWDKVTKGERGTDFDTFCEQIESFPDNQVWRYGQAGDLPGEGDKIDTKMMTKLAKANAGRPVIAYTHKPTNKGNLKALSKARANGFSVNLSADNLTEADELAKTGLPVVVVMPSEYARATKLGDWSETVPEYNDRVKDLPNTTPQGARIAICPATYLDVTCGECLACAKPDRNGTVIGFPAHGSKRKRVTEWTRNTPLQ